MRIQSSAGFASQIKKKKTKGVPGALEKTQKERKEHVADNERRRAARPPSSTEIFESE